MELITEIICENFEQKKIIDNKIIVKDKQEEYYIIPLSKSFDMEADDEVCKLIFNNQLLWLKYSNFKGEILLKESDYTECVLIRSDMIYDMYLKIKTDNYMRKNVWSCRHNVNMNKQYLNSYFLVIPIIEDMIRIRSCGINQLDYRIKMISNEVLLKKVASRNNGHGYISVDNNVLLNKDALFIELNDYDVSCFME